MYRVLSTLEVVYRKHQEHISIKACFVLRQDLDMSVAKLAIEVGHGTDMIHLHYRDDPMYVRWIEEADRKKVVLRIKTLVRLENLIALLEESEIAFEKIYDRGYTEFGQTTLTGIIIFPTEESSLPRKVQKLQLWK
jgi:peptidyl-tRNA hydrolase